MKTVVEVLAGAVLGYLLYTPVRRTWCAWRINRIAKKLIDGTYDYETALEQTINEDPMRWW